jgi:glycosyltransferase involved in cell wall biosynthesis
LNPKVSIIIPNYNHAAFLQQRLDSVFNQTFQDFEVILLDDASIDGSVKLLKSYKTHPKLSHLVLNPVNSGSPFKQWQKGIELAQGNYIWIAESDDYCELTFLERTINYLLNEADICYVQTYDVDELGVDLKSRLPYTNEFKPNIWQDDFKMEGDVFNLNYLLVKNVIPNASAVLFKRSSVKAVFFDEVLLNMKMCGDWLFWIRLCNGNRIAFVGEALNYFRCHDSITRIHDTQQKLKKRIQEEAILRSVVYQDLRIRNKDQENIIFNKWFNLHGFFKVFTKSFYSLYLVQTTRKDLFLKFVLLKLKKRFKF